MVELLVVVAIIAVLLGLVVGVTAGVRKSARSAKCLNQLRQIGMAFIAYAEGNRSFLPEPSITNKSWEQLIQPHYGGGFECPADAEVAPTLGSSYDWRDTGDARTSFAGRSLQSLGPGSAVLAFESLSGWHSKGSLNVVRLDGAAMPMLEKDVHRELAGPFTR